jgi:mRNA-degrading endonuclease RelE of RelBE toxin-antitoxin system
VVDRSTFSIELSEGAERDLEKLPLDAQRSILTEAKKWLRADPFREVKRRIKRLSAFNPPLYRLRIGDYRAYYRIVAERVVIIAILDKKESDRWLRRFR